MTHRSLDIGFELSNLCNLHCTHCIRGSHQTHLDYLDLSLFRRILDEAAEMFSPIAVIFTGGEPLATHLFPPAVEELGARDVPYRFVTNGWLIPRHLPLLRRYPPRFVRISLSGATENTHDRQRGRGSFRHALVGAATLMASGIRTEMSMVVTRESRAQVSEAVALANQLGIAELHFILPQPTLETALANIDLSPPEWDTVAAEVRSLARTSATNIGLDYGTYAPYPRPACNTMALRQIYVDARGCVPFCCQLSRYGTGPEPVLGDLTTETFGTVISRAASTYAQHAGASDTLYRLGRHDALDEYPCMSCARRHGRTGFLAEFPEHPWAALATVPG